MNRQDRLDDLGFDLDRLEVALRRIPGEQRYRVTINPPDGEFAGYLEQAQPVAIGEGAEGPGSVVGYLDRAVRGITEGWFLTRSLEGFHGVVVHSRTYWGAVDYRGTPVPMTSPKRIVIHHTAGGTWSKSTTAKETAVTVGLIQVDHLQRKPTPWRDIGYHFLVDPAGRIFRGRPPIGGELSVGSHLGGMNSSSIGVALLGAFETEAPTEAALVAVGRLCGALCRRYEINPADWPSGETGILPHNRFAATVCPGHGVLENMQRIRRLAGEEA